MAVSPGGGSLPMILDDVLVCIFPFLSEKELSKLCRVCWSWNTIAQPILQRRRVFTFSLLRGDDNWDIKRLEQQRQLIHSSNVGNVRHLALSNRHSTAIPLAKDNASCIFIFAVLQQVARNLASLHIEDFNFTKLDSAFTFPPLPLLRSFVVVNTDQEVPLALEDAFPHYSASSHLKVLVLPMIDQLSTYHLSSYALTHLELTTQNKELDEHAKGKIRSLTCLTKLKWTFVAPPLGCILPSFIRDLTLRSVRKSRSVDPVSWSIEEAFPNVADLSNLSSLALANCVPLSPNFPPCQSKLVTLRAGETLENEGDSVFKLLHSSAESLSDFQFTVTSLHRLRQLVYLYCGGRNNSDPTIVDTFRLLSSRIKSVYFGHEYERRNFQARGVTGGELRLLVADLEGESDIATALISAVQEGLLPALEVVALPCEMEKEVLKAITNLGNEHHFKVRKLRFRSSTQLGLCLAIPSGD
ncbi:hypothetical protein BT69DRAFT_1282975, partial [Atractiella rhizophila]